MGMNLSGHGSHVLDAVCKEQGIVYSPWLATDAEVFSLGDLALKPCQLKKCTQDWKHRVNYRHVSMYIYDGESIKCNYPMDIPS